MADYSEAVEAAAKALHRLSQGSSPDWEQFHPLVQDRFRVDCPACDALLLRGGAAVVPDNQGEEAA